MSRAVHVLIAAALVLVLVACQSSGAKRTDPATAVEPVVQIVERIVYVPIDSALTAPEPIAEGPLSQCPSVAAQRRAALQRCNAKLRQAGQVQGTPVEADGK